MSALATKSQPNLAYPPALSDPSKILCSLLQSLGSIAGKAREVSLSWKVMNVGADSSGWQRRWKLAQGSLATLRSLSEP